MDLHRVIDALAHGFEEASDALEVEQAVHGLDARRELELHVLAHASLRAAGFGVFPEERFPMDRGARKRSAGARCDIVITEDARPLVRDAAQLGLFDPRDPVPLAEACFLEMKCVAQMKASGPNRAYARALVAPVWRDVEKLARDPGIVHAAVLLVLFTASREVADHDLAVWAGRASVSGLPLGPRLTRDLVIGDRLGNRVCTLSLFPLLRSGW